MFRPFKHSLLECMDNAAGIPLVCNVQHVLNHAV